MFASLFRADAGGDRSPFGDFWFSAIGGARTAAGQRVNADTAMQLATVFACTRVVSEAMGVLPFRLYQPKVGGGRQRVTDHWLLRLLARRPNQFQNWFEWRTMMQGHLALRGNGYNIITPDGRGGISSLLPVHPDRIKVEPLDNGSWRYRRTLPNGSQEILSRQEVWHLRSLSTDGISGISPIEAAREVIGGALGVQDFGNRFFANDAKPTGGWLEIPGTIANDATRDKLKEQAQKAVSGVNRHRMLVLDRGMKYHEVGLTNKDSQFLELRKFSRSEICGIFRVPPHMAADLERATFSNIEQQGIDFWQNTMLPWVTLWEAAAGDLLGDDSDLEPQFDFTAMLRGDSAARAQYLHNLVLDGILTRNEAREMEGFDPIDGLEEPLVPVNERGLNDPPPPAPGTTPAAPTEPDGDDSADARLAALVEGNAGRMARRVAAGDAPTAQVLAAALAIPEFAALAWLETNTVGGCALSVEEITASLRALGGTK
jgi:HK97 family phage portal protein